MVAHQNQAWVTAVLNDGDTNKAIVLAGSLRRALTTKKIVAVYTPNVSEDARDLLRDKFDLAVLLDQRIPDGVHPEDVAKIFAFSFDVFNKCIYLSTSTMALQNCDEIFHHYNKFAAFVGKGGSIDTSVFLFTPSIQQYKAMKKIIGNGHLWKGNTLDNGHFSNYFGKWLLNQDPDIETLKSRYNQRITLLDENEIYDGSLSDLAIVNFTDVHPMGVADKILSSCMPSLGMVEALVAEKWLAIYTDEILTRGGEQAEEVEDKERSSDSEPIAIVGMACRLPSANNIDEFWKLLIEGRDGIKTLPNDRWGKDNTLFRPKTRDVSGGFLSVPIDEYDAKFFGISPKEADYLDPQQRLLHEVVWESLEDANIDPHGLAGTSTGVFVGSWLSDYKDLVYSNTDLDFFRTYMGNSIASQAARLSHFLGLTGESIATESGCSSGIVAVDLACHSLRNRNTNLALACGVNLFLHPFDTSTLSFVVAPDGHCKTFSANADGFGRAEGCGVLLLKRLGDAVKDNDKIWGLIRGSAITQEGVSKSLGTPTVKCESLAMELALRDADVNPSEVSFIETHGTGTPVGDPMEVAAIKKAYSSKNRSKPLIIGSVKTNVGHTESVSGITGIIKVILSLKNESIPRHLNFDTLNPEIDLESIPAVIPLEEIAWPRVTGKPRIAGVSSFGISGTDGHIIVQEAPDPYEQFNDFKCTRPLHIMKFSAKTAESLEELLQRYQNTLAQSDNENFADFAYTANTGRASFNHRAYITAKTVPEALSVLKQNKFNRKEVQPSGGRLCFLFTGQGSQYPGMAAQLYETSPVFKMHFEKCSRMLQKMYGISIKDVLWNSSNSEELSRTLYSQTSIFMVEYCILKLWESWGVKPDVVLGHSLGEFAAAVATGILNLKDALQLVAERSRLIDALPRGKMIVIKADKRVVDKTLNEFISENPKLWLDYAALNSPEQTVLAGDSKTVDEFAKFCEGKELKCIILAATHAFHSRHMDPMLKPYKEIAAKIQPGKQTSCSSEYISGMKGKLVEREDLLDPEYWVQHTREKVNFIEACKVAQAEGCTFFIEVGPHPVLSALAMANIDGSGMSFFPSLRRKQNDWTTILESLGKLFISDWIGSSSIDWKRYDEFYPRKKVTLPFYPFNRKKIWIDVNPIVPNLHPLLGGRVENASTSSIFQNNLSTKQVPFLNDHIIGSSIVMPGAAMLEMLLTAGFSHVQCFTEEFSVPRRPVTLKGMKIETPLGIDGSKAIKTQVVVDLIEESDDSGNISTGYKTRLYHWHKSEDAHGSGSGSGEWVSHASALFTPLVSDESLMHIKVDIENIHENWEESQLSSDLYKRLPEVGLKFGPTFQSLGKGWRKKAENGEEEEKESNFLVKVKVPADVGMYMAHPAIVDGMFQCIMLMNHGKEKNKKKLHVPVVVDSFTWYRAGSPAYLYCCSGTGSENNQHNVILLDENGNALMAIGGVEMISTTSSIIESMLQEQCSLPTLWNELWKNRPGPRENQVEYAKVEGALFPPNVLEEVIGLSKLEASELTAYKNLNILTILYFHLSLCELGWEPYPGLKFSLNELLSELGISETFKKFTQFFLGEMCKEGYLTEMGGAVNEDTFQVTTSLLQRSKLIEQISLTVADNQKYRADYKGVVTVGKALPEILLGKVLPLSFLFPEGQEESLADEYYVQKHDVTTQSVRILLNCVISRYSQGVNELKNPHGKIRMLEVGAGTGMHTGLLLKVVEEFDLPFEYCYTDISPVFFSKAEEKFEKYKDRMSYKKLNIEECPLAQGFSPAYYDIIIAAEVIHATRSIRETLGNLRLLLRDGGTVQIVETMQQDRVITFMFGLLEGYWRFQDFDLRPKQVTLSGKQWETVLEECGFCFSKCIPFYEDVHGMVFAIASENYYPDRMYRLSQFRPPVEKHTWLIFADESKLSEVLCKRLISLGRDIIVLQKSEYLNKIQDKALIEQILSKPIKGCKENDTTETHQVSLEGILYLWAKVDENVHDQSELARPFLVLCQYLWDNLKTGVKTFTVTHGSFSVDESRYLNPSPTTIVGMTRVLRAETSLSIKNIDIASNKDADDQIEQVFYEMWYNEDSENMIAYRDEKRITPRLATVKPSRDVLSLPKGTDRFQLILPETRVIRDLQFGFLNCYTLGEDEIEVKIKATALNFRDVFTVLKPDPQFEKLNSIGLDFSGVVVAVGSKVTTRKVGDAVFGANMYENLALPSHIKVREDMSLPIPDNMTFAEATTLPAVFATSFYCLLDVANITSADTILIHTASGGVGLAAIQIAQHYGATIIATAGNERKRTYLRNLGIKHVFHSRNTQYGDQILELTGGKGVNIVLNSLTGKGFKEASLKCCAKGARFVEMSKLSIWQPEEVKALREDVDYTIVDLPSLPESVWTKLNDKIKEFVKQGNVRPIPYVRFDAVSIRSALNYLQKAKHIGKVICIMPEIKVQDSRFVSTVPLFNDRSTYVVTGAITGGIGLETARFMLSQGAKYVILVGRNKAQEKGEELMKLWKSEGYIVHAWQADVGDFQQCKALFDKIKDPSNGLPPIRGVMHCAGTLSDGTIPNQTWESFKHTYNAKVDGSWNLHHLTLDCRLEFFVFFSSMASLFGTPAQANHASGNMFEDSLAHYRNSVGLPASTINWGPWGQVGIATEIEIPGFRPLSTTQGLMSLDYVLRSGQTEIGVASSAVSSTPLGVACGVMNVDSFSLFAQFCPGIKTYIDDRSLFAEMKGPVFNMNSDEFWNEVDSVEERSEKEEVFRKFIKVMVRGVLKMESDEPIDDHAEFSTLGVDSLMMLEMKNNLQNLFGNRMVVTASELKDCKTPFLLAQKLVDILLSSAVDDVIPTSDELKALMIEDSQLSKTVTANESGLKCPSQIKTVLITGCTGLLGPYILRHLTNMPQITQVVALVRKRGTVSGEERLLSSLRANGLESDIDMEKVRCIDGDVGQLKLGLSEALYEELSLSCDSVIHCAAKVDHVQIYRKTGPHEKFHVRTTNVLGTKNILEFVSCKKTKILMYPSTFAAIYNVDEKGNLSETWEPNVIPCDNLPYNVGYIISKFISEQLVKTAVERGVPCKTFRLPFIAGDSTTGRHNIQGNHTMLRFLAYLKVGALPENPVPIIQLSVDYCAEVMVRLFFDKTPFDVYNVLPFQINLEQEFVSVAKEFGYNLETVEYSDFLARIKHLGESSPLHFFMDHYDNENLYKLLLTGQAIPTIAEWHNANENFFHSEKLKTYCPDLVAKMESPLQTVKRDLQYLKDSGIFAKFGL